jgi:3-deoxy-D-manno-octulosonic-acid transferase
MVWGLSIRLASILGHSRARAFCAMRSPHTLKALSNKTASNDQPWAWFHCASLGEYEQTAPVIDAYLSLHPATPILLTLFSPSAHTPLTNTSPPSWLRPTDHICALPLDTPLSVRRFLTSASYNFKFFAAAKYEVWPELLLQLSTPPIPSYVFAAHILPGAAQLRPTPSGRFLFTAWSRLTGILTQSQSSTSLLASHGLSSTPTGDPRADRVLQLSTSSITPPSLLTWKGNSRLVVAGSTWPPEEHALANLSWSPDLKLIIAPHEVNPSNISRLLALFGERASLYSSGNLNSSILIIDSIGLLTSIYSLADLALVGGGFGAGIHNVLEPAAHSVPVITGPNKGRFREADALADIGALLIASTPTQLQFLLTDILSPDNSTKLSYSGKSAGYWVEEQSGAAEKIAKYLP